MSFLVKPANLLGLLLLMLPSAMFLWRNSDVPQFGDRHDDSLYYVSAKSLAEGHYRIESLPGKPAQTKYPPLYPLLLSIAWRLNPQFPDNLHIAAWLSWLALPVLLVLLRAYYPRMGIDGPRLWILLALLGVNPYVILFSATLFSELWFTALLIGVLLLVDRAAEPRSSITWAIAAAILAGLSYLTRSAGIVLLASGPLYLWIRRERKKALAFAAVMFPFVVAWSFWSRSHQLHTDDFALVYYTDYIRYEFYTVHWSNLHLVLWKNIDGFLWGLGSLVLPKVVDSTFVKILSEVFAVAMISGIIRMVRAGRAWHYAMFGVGSSLLLIIWHFPPNERFVLPIVPLAFAGLLTEMEHFAGMVRKGMKHPDKSQRGAAALMSGAVAVVLAGCIGLQGYVSMAFLPEVANSQREHNVESRQAYAWVRDHVPPSTTLIAAEDPVMYLYTGRTSISRPLPPAIWYAEDHAGRLDLVRTLPDFAHDHGAQYIYYATEDIHRDTDDEDAKAIEEVILKRWQSEIVYARGDAKLYRVD